MKSLFKRSILLKRGKNPNIRAIDPKFFKTKGGIGKMEPEEEIIYFVQEEDTEGNFIIAGMVGAKDKTQAMLYVRADGYIPRAVYTRDEIMEGDDEDLIEQLEQFDYLSNLEEMAKRTHGRPGTLTYMLPRKGEQS